VAWIIEEKEEVAVNGTEKNKEKMDDIKTILLHCFEILFREL
jgi:hypothetical protein